MEQEPTTLTQLRSTISKRASEAKALLTSFTQSVATHLTAAETAATNAKTHATNAEAQLTAAKTSKDNIVKLETDATTSFEAFDTVMQEAMDSKSGVAAVAAIVSDTHEETQELKKEISGFRDESLTMKGDIEKNRDESQQAKNTLSDVLTDSQDIKEKIDKTYKIATDAGLAGSLSQRKVALTKQAIAWAVIAIIAFAVTIWITKELLPDLTKEKQALPIILSKLFYISPTFIFTIFAITQYRNERRLLEEYAFKAAMANSLESYTQLLGREFDDPKFRQEILDFVLPAMRNIYDREPLVAPKMTFIWSLGSKLAKLEAVVKEEASVITQKTVEATDDISTQINEVAEELRPVTAKPKKAV